MRTFSIKVLAAVALVGVTGGLMANGPSKSTRSAARPSPVPHKPSADPTRPPPLPAKPQTFVPLKPGSLVLVPNKKLPSSLLLPKDKDTSVGKSGTAGKPDALHDKYNPVKDPGAVPANKDTSVGKYGTAGKPDALHDKYNPIPKGTGTDPTTGTGAATGTSTGTGPSKDTGAGAGTGTGPTAGKSASPKTGTGADTGTGAGTDTGAGTGTGTGTGTGGSVKSLPLKLSPIGQGRFTPGERGPTSVGNGVIQDSGSGVVSETVPVVQAAKFILERENMPNAGFQSNVVTVGVFDSRGDAEIAAELLKSIGYATRIR
jgi:hypothetical protein